MTSEVALRQRKRELQQCGWLRCATYLGNIVRMNDLPFQEVDNGEGGTDYWVPAWLEWHMYRFSDGLLAQVPMRERLEQARALLNDKQAQYDLLCESLLAGASLNDPDGDLSTQHAIDNLKKELDHV